MKQTRLIMGMPVVVEIVGEKIDNKIFQDVFTYFTYVDKVFSPYKPTSEVSKINKGQLHEEDYSKDMQQILTYANEASKQTQGFFTIYHKGVFDPSGIVKGWAILHAANMVRDEGYTNYYVEAGGDIQLAGKNVKNKPWKVGIRNPFNKKEVVKVLSLTNCGIATSGTYIRGQHIYNPFDNDEIKDIVSISVIGPNIYDADKFATAGFAMGKKGIGFLESLAGFEGYMIDKDGVATMTTGFEKYVEAS